MNSSYQHIIENSHPHSNQKIDIQLTDDQKNAVQQIKDFALSNESCFILSGSAGTGKTTIIRSICHALNSLSIHVHLCAPTGRASRILKQKTGYDAVTIHSSIYTLDKLEVRQETADKNDPTLRYYFPLKVDQPTQAVWIIDESSMVGDTEVKSDTLHFGSGRLLSDLLHYLRLDRETVVSSGMKVIFVGDPIQLPPVGSKHSALDVELIHSKLGKPPRHLHLSRVLRQAQDSGILSSATCIRDAVEYKQLYQAKIKYNHDVRAIKQAEVFQKLLKAHQQDLSCVAITYSNAEASQVIRTMRELIFQDESKPLQPKERIIVMKNHHGYQLNNGDQLKVISSALQTRNALIPLKGRQAFKLKFIQVQVLDLSDPNRGIGLVWVLDNTLWLRDREEPAELTQALIIDFEQRLKEYCSIHQSQIPKRGSRAFSKFLMEDQFFNALRVRFAYAMTCHKAQGGEWDEVILKPKSIKQVKSESDAKWLYTGITRASRTLYIMNDEQEGFEHIKQSQASSLPRNNSQHPSCPLGSEDCNLDDEQKEIKNDVSGTCSSDKSLSQYIPVKHLNSLNNEQRVLAKLTYAFKALTLSVNSIKSLQYRYRVTFQKENKLRQIDFNYNGKAKLTKISDPITLKWGLNADFVNGFILVDRRYQRQPYSSDQSDDNEINSIDKQYIMLGRGLNQDLHKSQLKHVLNKLSSTKIMISEARSEPFALSLFLTGPKGEGRISFFHNGKKQWTSCRAINQLPTSLEAIQIFN